MIGAWLVARAAVTVAQAPPADAAPPMSEAARAHYDRGLALFAAKDYRAAIAELAAGFAIEPRREFLFAEAQAQRLGGDCRGAVALYQRFLATEPPAIQVSAAQVGLARCAQQMATAPPPAPLIPTPAPAVPAPSVDRGPWYRDAAGGVLLGAGIVAAGVGAGLVISAADATNTGVTYDDYSQKRASIERRWNIGAVALAAGAVLAGAGVFRYQRLRAAESAAAISVAAGPSFGGVSLEGRF
ncbi:MAG TPA: hypothetical protein VMU50_08690 [Polyangia bacterium]|nr:hypothetical protein [Polyangia bacterium]